MAAILENMFMLRLHMNYRSARNLVLDGRVRLHMDKDEPWSQELEAECEKLYKEKFDGTSGDKARQVHDNHYNNSSTKSEDDDDDDDNRKDQGYVNDVPSFETAETAEETLSDHSQYLEPDLSFESVEDDTKPEMVPHEKNMEEGPEVSAGAGTTPANPKKADFDMAMGKAGKAAAAVDPECTEEVTETEALVAYEDDDSHTFAALLDQVAESNMSEAALVKSKDGFLRRSFRRFSRISKKKRAKHH